MVRTVNLSMEVYQEQKNPIFQVDYQRNIQKIF